METLRSLYVRFLTQRDATPSCVNEYHEAASRVENEAKLLEEASRETTIFDSFVREVKRPRQRRKAR